MDSRQRNERYRSKRKKKDQEGPRFEPFTTQDNRIRSLDAIDSRYFSNKYNNVKRSSSFDFHEERHRRSDVDVRFDNRDNVKHHNSYQSSDRNYVRDPRYHSSRDEDLRYRDKDRHYSSHAGERRQSSHEDTERRYSSRDDIERRHSRRDDAEYRRDNRDDAACRRDSRDDGERRRDNHDGHDGDHQYKSRDDNRRYAESSDKRHSIMKRGEDDIERRYDSRDERNRSSKWYFCDTCQHIAYGQGELKEHFETSYHRLNRELEGMKKPFPIWSPVRIDSETGLPRCEVCPFKYHHQSAWNYHLNCNAIHWLKSARADPRLEPLSFDDLIE